MKSVIFFVLTFVFLVPTVISDGGSCFLPGTKISMADGTTKAIEDVAIGDRILSFDTELNVQVETVKEIEAPIRDHHYVISLENGQFLNTTNDHPLYMKSQNFQGWGSLEPDASFKEYGFQTYKIEEGHFLFTQDKEWVAIDTIAYVPGDVQTYNLIWVSNTHTFFAEGFLVHNKAHEGGGGHACTPGGHGGGGGCVADYNTGCGFCGTVPCEGGCDQGGVCNEGTTTCSGTRLQTCTASCSYITSGGTDADGDGTDAECGDAVCDNEPALVDSESTPTERGGCALGSGHSCSACSDGVDNDCDGLVDRADPDCCTQIHRSCAQYTDENLFRAIQRKLRTVIAKTNFMVSQGNLSACATEATDTACCANPNACVIEGQCYEPGSRVDPDGDGLFEICVGGAQGRTVP